MSENLEKAAENPAESSEMDAQDTMPVQPEKTERELAREERVQRRLENAEATAVFKENVHRDMENRLEYLLKETEIYNHFISNNKRRQDENTENSNPRKPEKSNVSIHRFAKTPDYIVNGEMREYQVDGLNWMISLHENGISGILADEMGLGKTLQTIAFLGYLKNTKKLSRHLKYLVVVPKTTMQNWLNEFEHWCPTMVVVDLQGEKELRKKRIKDEIMPRKWDVLLTSYEMIYMETNLLKKFKYHTIILDEGHRIKNENSLTARRIRELKSNHRMILTGTPIHNSVHELWALMNFLLPDFFNSGEDFDKWFQDMECINNETVIERLRAIIKPFVLRRIKADVEKSIKPKQELKVYVGMTKLQREWYHKVLLKEVTKLSPLGDVYKVRLDMLLMHLRKVANHPYIFEGAEEGPPFFPGEHLVENSGKMVIMDKLLARLKEEGSRVLIFSQMTRMLDIIEDYCNYRGYTYCRIDGDTKGDMRSEQIDEYNKPGSDKFLFLLSTRSGGLGINLATADSVIIYDSDFNPQMDLQAMDRSHRIGQTKQVRVFKLILENSVDDRIVEAAEMKATLDQKIKKGSAPGTQSGILRKIITMEMGQDLEGKHSLMMDEDLDSVLARSEERQQKELAEKSDQLKLQLKYESLYKFDGEDFKEKRDKIHKKFRDEAPDVPRWSRQARIKSKNASTHIPYCLQHYEPHWFFPKPLKDYVEREKLLYMKTMGHEIDDFMMQRKIEQVQPITVTERTHYDELLEDSFKHWSKEQFEAFIIASSNFGRNNIKKIATAIRGKNQYDVTAYWKVFWECYTQLPDYEKYIRRIEFGEAMLAARKKRPLEDNCNPIAIPSSSSVIPLVSAQDAQRQPLGQNGGFLSLSPKPPLISGQKRPHENYNPIEASAPKKPSTMENFLAAGQKRPHGNYTPIGASAPKKPNTVEAFFATGQEHPQPHDSRDENTDPKTDLKADPE